MIELNLETKTKEQEIIKEYLQENVSEILAEKINNGVHITKEDKTLINKKDLNRFMKYANDEARKLAEKGANCACIEDKTVFGWAIHYFEEDSIEGTLFNEDGTEFTSIKPKVESKPTKTQPIKKKEQQPSLFDLFNIDSTEKEQKVETDVQNKYAEEQDDDEWTKKEKEEALQEIEGQVVDLQTGEVIKPTTSKTQSVDKELAITLNTLLDFNLEVK